jgi:hypothetical protein
MWLLLRLLPKGIGSSQNAPRCILSDWGRDFDVATIRDASPEKISFVLPRTIGATGCRIADLTRWKLFRPKDFALPRHLRGKGTAPTLIFQSSRMANLLPESAMTGFSPPFLPVSRQEAHRSSGLGTHQMRLTVNLKTAKTLGVEVSRSVLRAACSGLPRS